ncbi:hypothetical protein BGW42_007869 [Actinomortierella wolfii]|nr:hypothetical protein BGW42_007869 [Actinomortierella wolfii]
MAFSLPSNPAFDLRGSTHPLQLATNGLHDIPRESIPHAIGTNGHTQPLLASNGQASKPFAVAETGKPTAPDYHVFHVANKALQDCVDLLEKIRKAVAQAEREMAAVSGESPSHHLEEDQTENKIDNNAMCSQAQQPVSAHPAVGTVAVENGNRGKHEYSAVSSTGKNSLVGMYTRYSVLSGEGTIGKHVRHLADHYRLLLGTYPGSAENSVGKEWRVDYDKRSRDVPMETDITVAIKVLKGLQDLLHEFDPSNTESKMTNRPSLDHPISLMATIDPAYAPVPFHSTLGRELWFCALHAVHHFAMVKVICGEFGMHDLAAGFGVAPSTLQHEADKKMKK